jgi:hypothetical protein
MNLARSNNKPRHQQIFLFTLLGLLILRIAFFGGLGSLTIQWEWTNVIYQIGTYLLTTFLIWWEIDHLGDYHIDTLAIMIVLFKPMQTLVLKYWSFRDPLLTFPSIPSLVVWLIAIAFALGIWWKRSKLPGITSIGLRWLFIGIAAGLLTSVALSFFMSLQIPGIELSGDLSAKDVRSMLSTIPAAFLHQIAYAAISEEPLFRGFLWGWLKKLNWHEAWIWLFQAGLFMIGHIYYITRAPILFWIVVPVDGLIFGFLAWRSRTIASSMAAHGMTNATARMFGYLLAAYRLG